MSTIGPDFRVTAKLGEGSFAEVFKVKSSHGNEYFAVKRLKKRYRSIEEVNRLPEILALKALQGHQNVIRLVDLIYDNNNGYVAMAFELMDCNVYELITDHKKPFDERTSLLLIYQLLKAVAFMHSKNLFHRDIKPENCMVNKDTMTLKLCDFGSTRGLSSNAPYTEYVSTRWYRAPECILTSGSYGPEVDEWAIGCMLYELMTSRPLFPGKHEVDQIGRIHNLLGTPAREVLAQFKRNPNTQISFAFPQRQAQDLHKLLPRASQGTIDLLHALLIYNPCERISAVDALKMPCFDELRAADAEWSRGSQGIPFGIFFLRDFRYSGQTSSAPQVQESEPKPVFGPPKPENVVARPKPVFVNAEPGTSTMNQKLKEMTKTKFQKPKPMSPIPPVQQQPPPVQPQPVYVAQKPVYPSVQYQQKMPAPMITSHAIYVPPQKPAPLIHKPQPKVTKPLDASLVESRIRAAQRIKAYQQAINASKAAKKPQPFHGAAFQFASKQGVYQKPRPDLVQPRLPKIVL